jgi:hypothetical protein
MLTIIAAMALAGQWPEKEWAFKDVEAGGTSPLTESVVFILRSEGEFREYNRKRGSPRRPLPKINWKLNQVIAVHVGQKPTASYGVDVKRVTKQPYGADVEVVITKPDPEMMVAQVITYPFAVIRTERFAGRADLKVVED